MRSPSPDQPSPTAPAAETVALTLALEPAALARLDCVAAGLLPATALTIAVTVPETVGTVVLTDPEGVPRARLVPGPGAWPAGRRGGALTLLGAATTPTYAGLRAAPGAVTADVAVLAVDAPSAADVREAAGQRTLLLLAAAGAARADDAGHHRRIAGWRRLAEETGGRLVVTPVPDDASPSERTAVATAYGVTLLDVPPGPAPATGDGAVVMLSGLSGSGKSTIAGELVALLTESAGRTVTLLDGDVVRTHLSQGLGFSKSDRDTNIRRIGWVAAEVAKHGGLAVCAPIAPYAATREAVRAMVESQSGPGSFVLVHVATSLEECERRDRKGLYAKARAGLIPEFTGISDPYEVPTDAALVLDTEDLSARQAAESVVAHLTASGRLR